MKARFSNDRFGFKDEYVFSQLVKFLDYEKFKYIVKKYNGNKYIKSYTC